MYLENPQIIAKTISRGIIPLLITGLSQDSIASKLNRYSFNRTKIIVIATANTAESFADFFPFSETNHIPVSSSSCLKKGMNAIRTIKASGIKNPAKKG
jgi:hypothetical protein